MDLPLPSPGFSIPSIGTPLHQPEEDQQILPTASPMHSTSRQPTSSSAFGLTLPHQQQSSNTAASSQPLYSMPGFTPQHMLQPQTPQALMSPAVNRGSSGMLGDSHMHSQGTPAPLGLYGPSTPAPMTPHTPASADPGIVPQLQNIVSTVNLGCKLDLKKNCSTCS